MKSDGTLYAFYDLSVSPVTFDFVVFLILAEHERQKRSLDAVHIVVVPGVEEGFRRGDVDTYKRFGASDHDAQTLRWRLSNIVIPSCWLLPSCRSVTVCRSRGETNALLGRAAVNTFPVFYDPQKPKASYGWRFFFDTTDKLDSVASLAAGTQATRHVNAWRKQHAGGRKIITITLRECAHELDRNSDLKSWSDFARGLDRSVYYPVVLRDTGAAFGSPSGELDPYVVFPEVAWNLELRAALYEASYLNLFVNNGPAMLGLFNRKCRTLIFKIITESCGATTRNYFESIGVGPGSQYRLQTPVQKLIWDDDRLDVISDEFEKMVENIEWFYAAPLSELVGVFDGFIGQGDLGKALWVATVATVRFPGEAAACRMRDDAEKVTGSVPPEKVITVPQ